MSMQNTFIHTPPSDFKKAYSLSRTEARREMELLAEALEYHNHRYYVKNDPEISDSAYDRLFNRLQELEGLYPEYVSSSSPTKRVGSPPVSSLEKVTHRHPLLSLESSEHRAKVEDFLRSVRKKTGKREPPFVLEPKLDGFSVELIYENGSFSRGSTRGDGYTGEDISDNLRTISRLPLRLLGAAPSFLAVRGEVAMPKEGFQRLNRRRIENGLNPLANPRSAFAWKFPPKKEINELREIVVQVGRTGMLTPVALLDPVEVSGVTVSRATLHNEEQVRQKDVRPGDRVRIFRAGDVIPEVAKRISVPGKKRKTKFTMPANCPSCGAMDLELKRRKNSSMRSSGSSGRHSIVFCSPLAYAMSGNMSLRCWPAGSGVSIISGTPAMMR